MKGKGVYPRGNDGSDDLENGHWEEEPTSPPLNDVTISIRLPHELAEWIDKLAKQERRSRSNCIRWLLAQAWEAKELNR